MPDPQGRPAAARVSRRTVLSLAAGAAALNFAGVPAFAGTADVSPQVGRFLSLSRKITGRRDLNPLTATRILGALKAEGAVEQLAALADTARDAADLRERAMGADLLDPLTAILSAWYTGTVEGPDGPVVVAYRDALMYRPTEDGLVVPTYCSKGPMWWENTLPPGITRNPVNIPEVL